MGVKVKDALGVAELFRSAIIKGHYYWAGNDPVGHGNHVHVAFTPWGMPDDANANPLNPCATAAIATAKAAAYRVAFEAKWGNRFPWLGTCVRKHRNEDPAEPWSQHTFGNAVDYGANGVIGQQPIIDWLESEEAVGVGSADTYFDAVTAAGLSAAEFGKDQETAHGFWRRVRGQTRPDPANDPDAADGWDAANTMLAPGGTFTFEGSGGPK